MNAIFGLAACIMSCLHIGTTLRKNEEKNINMAKPAIPLLSYASLGELIEIDPVYAPSPYEGSVESQAPTILRTPNTPSRQGPSKSGDSSVFQLAHAPSREYLGSWPN
jgi:hypothetical protein